MLFICIYMLTYASIKTTCYGEGQDIHLFLAVNDRELYPLYFIVSYLCSFHALMVLFQGLQELRKFARRRHQASRRSRRWSTTSPCSACRRSASAPRTTSTAATTHGSRLAGQYLLVRARLWLVPSYPLNDAVAALAPPPLARFAQCDNAQFLPSARAAVDAKVHFLPDLYYNQTHGDA
jgi:hypothetical protein